jgi:predicted RNA binding protein YcfA (HicA-like mRNA interferase family)
MRIPRDLSGADLIKRLERLGYEISRQTGSHVRLTSRRDGEHHVTVPKHDPNAIKLSPTGRACSCRGSVLAWMT